jgi:hypothetical protein
MMLLEVQGRRTGGRALKTNCRRWVGWVFNVGVVMGELLVEGVLSGSEGSGAG